MESLMKYIGRLSRIGVMHRSYELEAEGLNGHQHSYILRICQQPGITQNQLAKLLYVHKSNVARQVNLLEKEGYLIRMPMETDKRVLQLIPTEKAKVVFPKVHQVLAEWNDFLMEDFPEEKKAEIIGALAHILEKATERIDRENAEREDGL